MAIDGRTSIRWVVLAVLGVAGAAGGNDTRVAPAPAKEASARPAGRLETPPPPFSEGIFPCTNCHAGMTPDRNRRTLTAMHTDIVLKHDEEHRWCLDCHDAGNRDFLHLASGERIPFEESYLLCGQCHHHLPHHRQLFLV